MRLTVPLLAACASFACLGASGETVTADDDKRESQVDSNVATPQSKERAKDYWTVERMRKAKPMPSPVLDPETLKPVDPE
ncbi:hypothetical protein [Bauldia litoralis]|uniref:Uncharacterized protein n=1 Tax=Bauldia litoralis TaxID=665467 RepID=A0A1G6ASD2_9HYPH|nr:hypothetical protein [Bauldia litoralis]SDB11287.1 hypothetical protein SAMN02982931_00814 [Bauldia litoralis]